MRTIVKKNIMQRIVLCACIGMYVPWLYAPVDPQTDQGCRQIAFNMGTVIDGIESTVDSLLMDADFNASFLGALESKIDEIDSKADEVLVAVSQEVADLVVLDSKVDQIDSKLDDCCVTLNSSLDELSVDFQETWTVLGSNGEVSLDPFVNFSTVQDIDDAQISIVQLLKSILNGLLFGP